MTTNPQGQAGDRSRPRSSDRRERPTRQAPRRPGRQGNRNRLANPLPAPTPEPLTEGEPVDHVISDLPANGSVERTTEQAAMRKILVVAVTVLFGLALVLAFIGNLMGRIGPQVLVALVAALTTAFGLMARYYFRRTNS